MVMMDQIRNLVEYVEARKGSVEFIVNPATFPALVNAMLEAGENPFPRMSKKWWQFWKKPDASPYLFGMRVLFSEDAPVGGLGIRSNVKIKKELLDAIRAMPFADDEEKQECAIGGGDLGFESSLSAIVARAMEDIEKFEGIVILRFEKGGSFDSMSSYNDLELQGIMQRATLRILQGGM